MNLHPIAMANVLGECVIRAVEMANVRAIRSAKMISAYPAPVSPNVQPVRPAAVVVVWSMIALYREENVRQITSASIANVFPIHVAAYNAQPINFAATACVFTPVKKLVAPPIRSVATALVARCPAKANAKNLPKAASMNNAYQTVAMPVVMARSAKAIPASMTDAYISNAPKANAA